VNKRETINLRIAEFVRINREKNKLSQRQLSTKAGIGCTQIFRLEGGENFNFDPKLSTLIKICTALNTDLIKLANYIYQK